MPHQCTTCGKVFADGSKEMLSGCPSCGGNKFQFKPKTGTSGAASSSDSTSTDTSTQSGSGTRDLTSSAADAVRERVSETDVRPDVDDEELTVSDWVDAKGGSPSPAETQPSDTPSAPPTESSDEPRAADSSREWGQWPDAPDASDDSPQGDAEVSPASESAPGEQSASRPHIRARETDEDNSQKSARSDVVSPDELAALDEKRRASSDVEPGVTPADSDTQNASPSRTPAEEPPDVDGTTIEPSSDERPNLDELREELNDQFESIKIVNPGQYELNLMELYDRDEYIISLKEDGRYVIEVPDSWGPGSRED
ncbi:OapC/ArvC family zinc-ribbon domain-containing protein [Haloferax sp. DFSO52]|uniref:OapC/ArvC family zinc-ribbon domain-containing protein n=1 Tax=Haloferax sp. DFSO52 TaxID=3388505 RepID=UPI003A87361E